MWDGVWCKQRSEKGKGEQKTKGWNMRELHRHSHWETDKR